MLQWGAGIRPAGKKTGTSAVNVILILAWQRQGSPDEIAHWCNPTKGLRHISQSVYVNRDILEVFLQI